MSDAIRIAPTQPGFSRSLPQRQHTYLPTYSSPSSSSFQLLRHAGRLRLGFISKPKALTRNEDGALIDLPVSVPLQPIVSHGHFDQTITQSPEPVIILWMATWCRKCIYLKPKLEKLAAEYFPSRIRFYSIDVNAVPHKLVAHAEITKMPTIQVWRDGKKQGEVIGGHKAHLVIDEVREMIENHCCP